MSKNDDDDFRILSKKELRLLCLYSPSHIARLEALGLFPKRVRLGHYRGSRVGWRYSEVTAWLRERFAERDKVTN
jgi:prophage regulatory protein